MIEPNTPLSASRIKTLQTCSWLYWTNYKLKLPNKNNHGNLRGSICHAIFENLGNPKHKHHYDSIIESQDIFVSKPIKRMVMAYAKKYDDKRMEIWLNNATLMIRLFLDAPRNRPFHKLIYQQIPHLLRDSLYQMQN